MIVTECVVAILGALVGTYETNTLTLFKFHRESRNYQVIASVASTGSDIWSTGSLNENFSHLSDFIKSPARIKGVGNVFEICPEKVTLEDCELVYPSLESSEYISCSFLANKKKPAILFPLQRSKEQSLIKMFKKGTRRNKSPTSLACLQSLNDGKEKLLSKLSDRCTHDIIRDLMYSRMLKLTGSNSCDDLGLDTKYSLEADIPLIIRLDKYHIIFENQNSFHIFTTDGFQILHLHTTGSQGIEERSRWIAVREGTESTMRIPHIIRKIDSKEPYMIQYFLGSHLNVRYKVCPFMKSLKITPGRESIWSRIRSWTFPNN
ncbi:hypothetical protein GcC1_062017 [Golovinomyces cichoracearum]|uniref:Uncharacterized protein n=1 Tax=Golovinomyces cichoracearum TaxID=62708 RepID=A0A420ISV2_9PEZI|nr:hypothetical protein GcC1_062017 [Golovinomyces cichoracearum]